MTLVVFEGALRPVVANRLIRTTMNEYRRKARLFDDESETRYEEMKERRIHLNPPST